MAGRTYTMGELVEALGAKEHQVKYAIKKLGVEPVERKTNGRLFGAAGLRKLRRWMEKNSKGVGSVEAFDE